MKKLKGVILIFLCALMLFSCNGRERSAQQVLSKFSDSYGTLCAGAMYFSTASEWEQEHLSEALFESLYMSETGECERDLIEECAVYLSSSLDSFCEVGVFICYGNADAERVAKMCHRRISLVSKTKREEGYSYKENSFVRIDGRYVIYSITPDKKAGERASKSCLQ